MTEGDEGETTIKPPDYGVQLWVVQIAVAIVASAFVLFRRISIPHCEQECDFALLAAAGDTFVLYAVALAGVMGLALLITRLATRGRRTTRRWDWLLPTGGIALTLAGALVANRISDTALLF